MGMFTDMLEQIEYYSPDNEIRRRADSMTVFADGDESINIRDWSRWYRACQHQGRQIPPAEFKAWPEEEKQKYSLIEMVHGG